MEEYIEGGIFSVDDEGGQIEKILIGEICDQKECEKSISACIDKICGKGNIPEIIKKYEESYKKKHQVIGHEIIDGEVYIYIKKPDHDSEGLYLESDSGRL